MAYGTAVALMYTSYLISLGMKRTAEVKRDAAIGEVEARRDAGIRVGWTL